MLALLMRIGMLGLVIVSTLAAYKDKYEISIILAIYAILLHLGVLDVERQNNK